MWACVSFFFCVCVCKFCFFLPHLRFTLNLNHFEFYWFSFPLFRWHIRWLLVLFSGYDIYIHVRIVKVNFISFCLQYNQQNFDSWKMGERVKKAAGNYTCVLYGGPSSSLKYCIFIYIIIEKVVLCFFCWCFHFKSTHSLHYFLNGCRSCVSFFFHCRQIGSIHLFSSPVQNFLDRCFSVSLYFGLFFSQFYFGLSRFWKSANLRHQSARSRTTKWYFNLNHSRLNVSK